MFLLSGFRPLLGPAYCIHFPSCTRYALDQLNKHSLWYASYMISKRLLTCHPFYPYFQKRKNTR